MQYSPLTPCCKALLGYFQDKTPDKVRTMQYISNAEFVKITTREERAKIEQLKKQAETMTSEHTPSHDQLAQSLQKSIETLWERYQELYMSAK